LTAVVDLIKSPALNFTAHMPHACISAGFPVVVPQLLVSLQVLVCWLLAQAFHAEHCQFGVQVQTPQSDGHVVQFSPASQVVLPQVLTTSRR
jgi:hypothetical protein